MAPDDEQPSTELERRAFRRSATMVAATREGVHEIQLRLEASRKLIKQARESLAQSRKTGLGTPSLGPTAYGTATECLCCFSAPESPSVSAGWPLFIWLS